MYQSCEWRDPSKEIKYNWTQSTLPISLSLSHSSKAQRHEAGPWGQRGHLAPGTTSIALALGMHFHLSP